MSMCAGVCASVRALVRPSLPESVPEYIIHRGHLPGARSPHTHTHTLRITPTFIIYAASRSVGRNLISLQAENLEFRQERMERPRKPLQVGPAPIPLIGFAAALKTGCGSQRRACKHVDLGGKDSLICPPQINCPALKWAVCLHVCVGGLSGESHSTRQSSPFPPH